MNSPKIVIGIVLFGQKYLEKSLPSLLASDYENLEILLIDQEEGVFSAQTFITENLPEVLADPRVTLLTGANLWHSGGQNRLIELAISRGAEFYLPGSQDMLYLPDTISQLVAGLQAAGESYGSVAPLLRQWHFSTENEKSNQIDSAGLQIFRSQKIVDRGQGEEDAGQFSSAENIFGPTGALAAFRISALLDIAISRDGKREFFSELIHYKNDCDLAYRLQWAGHACRFIPTAIAYHDRQVGGDIGFFAKIKKRNAMSQAAKESSFLGQLVLLSHNFSEQFSFRTRLVTTLAKFSRMIVAALEGYFHTAWPRFVEMQDRLENEKKQLRHRIAASEIEKFFQK